MNTVWRVRPMTEGVNESVIGVPALISRVLITRGIVGDAREKFLSPEYLRDLGNPLYILELPKALEIIAEHISKGSKILVHGDYDVDGITSSLVLKSTLQHLGAKVSHILPTRDQGYGMNKHSVEFIKKEKFDLVITVDCGIRDHEAIEELKKENIEVVVTDHHQVGESIPKASAVVDTSRPDETYEFRNFCGAGVAFKLSQALLARLKPDIVFEKQLLDLVALGTLADMMQLIGENRAIVKFGILMMAINKRPGIQALAELSNTELNTISAMDCGFRIIPYLNAAGRLEDPEIAFQLLAAPDLATAREYAKKLHEINTTRKDLTKNAFEAISAGVTDEHSVIFEASNEWPRGIAGLIANRLTEAFARPSLVIELTEEHGIGSARSVEGVNITKVLERASEHLVVFGGHKEAAGFTVKKERLELFKNDIIKYIEEERNVEVLEKEILADTECSFSEISVNVLDWLKRLAPFGEGNDEPIFLTRNVTLTDIKMVGQQQNHAKFCFTDDAKVTMKGIAFSHPEYATLHLGEKYDILYSLRENIWNGRRYIDLSLIDLKESKPHDI